MLPFKGGYTSLCHSLKPLSKKEENRLVKAGGWMKPILRSKANGCTYKAGIALDTALSLAERSLTIADTYPAGLIRYFPETGHIPSFVDNETRIKTTNKARGNLLSLIGLIKLKQGKESRTYIVDVLQALTDNETLANIGEYYRKTGVNKEAFEVYKKIMFQSPEDTVSFRKMKESYSAWKKSSVGMDTHLAELNEHWRVEMLKQLKKEIIRLPAPDFAAALVDLKGKPVAKESLQKKIIVLDFWATWCVPCMHEMPYLQNAYEAFRNDSNVVFMVINSGSKNTLQDAQGWWGNKRYSFPVYYNNDPMIGDKLKFNVIPATYIIDATGTIRFKTIGFEGAVIERKIKAAITLLKEEGL
ncbi:MAG TPA: TlpA disulfide reductase family protein [Chitinophagaceae bacterium]|nr:TlpA disulfide reductase family protein [Chitinophagaceae bacterium]